MDIKESDILEVQLKVKPGTSQCSATEISELKGFQNIDERWA